MLKVDRIQREGTGNLSSYTINLNITFSYPIFFIVSTVSSNSDISQGLYYRIVKEGSNFNTAYPSLDELTKGIIGIFTGGVSWGYFSGGFYSIDATTKEVLRTAFSIKDNQLTIAQNSMITTETITNAKQIFNVSNETYYFYVIGY